jgi:RHH-type rel operon transcriptional repressor/antitoxin RelB
MYEHRLGLGGERYARIAMIAVRLPKELEERLTALAQKTGRSKSYHVRQALLEYLEDIEDHYLAVERLESRLPGTPLEELERPIDNPSER